MNSANHTEKDSKTSSSSRSISKRWLLSQDEPRLYECGQIEELAVVMSAQAEACRGMEVPIALILMEVANFDEVKSRSLQTFDETVKEVAQNLFPVVRAQDVIVRYGERFIAILLVDANQDIGAKVCQRIKEAVHKFSYFHACASASLWFV